MTDVYFFDLLAKRPLGVNIECNHTISILMSYLEQRGISSSVKRLDLYNDDCSVNDEYFKSLQNGGEAIKQLEGIINKEDPRIVAFSLPSQCYNQGTAINKTLKQINPELTTMVGGWHATAFPEEALKDFDYVFVRDGYQTFPSIIEKIIRKNQYPGERIIIPENKFIDDVDKIPFPHPSAYKEEKHIMGFTPKLQITTSFGCDGMCRFCGGNLYRIPWTGMSAKRVVTEIMYQLKTYGLSEFSFAEADPLPFFTRRNLEPNQKPLERMEEIIDLIDENNLEVSLDLSIRTDSILNIYRKNPELLKKIFKHSKYISAGIDSLDEENLRRSKNQSVEETIEAVKIITQLADEQELIPILFMIIGYEKDTKESIISQMKKLKELSPNVVIPTFILTPDPGTPLYKELDKKGLIKNKNWPEYDHLHLVWEHPNFTPEELEEFYSELLINFSFPMYSYTSDTEMH